MDPQAAADKDSVRTYPVPAEAGMPADHTAADRKAAADMAADMTVDIEAAREHIAAVRQVPADTAEVPPGTAAREHTAADKAADTAAQEHIAAGTAADTAAVQADTAAAREHTAEKAAPEASDCIACQAQAESLRQTEKHYCKPLQAAAAAVAGADAEERADHKDCPWEHYFFPFSFSVRV